MQEPEFPKPDYYASSSELLAVLRPDKFLDASEIQVALGISPYNKRAWSLIRDLAFSLARAGKVRQRGETWASLEKALSPAGTLVPAKGLSNMTQQIQDFQGVLKQIGTSVASTHPDATRFLKQAYIALSKPSAANGAKKASAKKQAVTKAPKAAKAPKTSADVDPDFSPDRKQLGVIKLLGDLHHRAWFRPADMGAAKAGQFIERITSLVEANWVEAKEGEEAYRLRPVGRAYYNTRYAAEAE